MALLNKTWLTAIVPLFTRVIKWHFLLFSLLRRWPECEPGLKHVVSFLVKANHARHTWGPWRAVRFVAGDICKYMLPNPKSTIKFTACALTTGFVSYLRPLIWLSLIFLCATWNASNRLKLFQVPLFSCAGHFGICQLSSSSNCVWLCLMCQTE